jgi:hypothetical protein
MIRVRRTGEQASPVFEVVVREGKGEHHVTMSREISCNGAGAADRRHARLIRVPLPRISQPGSARRARPLKRTALLAKPVNGINAPQRPDCVAGVIGLELRNPSAIHVLRYHNTLRRLGRNAPPETVRV